MNAPGLRIEQDCDAGFWETREHLLSRPVSVIARDAGCLDYLAYLPRSAGPGAPLLVCLHGLKRNPAEQIFQFAPLADRYGIRLLAPLFARKRYHGFQSLVPDKEGCNPEEVFDATIEDFLIRFRVRAERLFLFGFSGGGQFAHRYAMLGRRRIDRMVLVAPGWFTLPDQDLPYPFGIGHSALLGGRRFDPANLFQIPSLLLVGDRDRARDSSLNRDPTIDRTQGRNRVERAERWSAELARIAREHGVPCNWETARIPGARHNFTKMMEQGALGELAFGWFDS